MEHNKLTITDPILGTRTIDLNDDLAFIRDQHRVLCAWRDDGRIPSQELLDDIKAYESIFNAENREERAVQYYEAQTRDRRRPREVARDLGWMK